MEAIIPSYPKTLHQRYVRIGRGCVPTPHRLLSLVVGKQRILLCCCPEPRRTSFFALETSRLLVVKTSLVDSDSHATPDIMRPFVIDNVRRQEDVTTESGVPAACFDECSKSLLSSYLLSLSLGLRDILLYLLGIVQQITPLSKPKHPAKILLSATGIRPSALFCINAQTASMRPQNLEIRPATYFRLPSLNGLDTAQSKRFRRMSIPFPQLRWTCLQLQHRSRVSRLQSQRLQQVLPMLIWTDWIRIPQTQKSLFLPLSCPLWSASSPLQLLFGH